MSKHDALMDEWDKITYGIQPGELHAFTLGTSARRVRKVSPVRQYQPYINKGDEDYAAKYQKDELKQAMLVNLSPFFSFICELYLMSCFFIIFRLQSSVKNLARLESRVLE